MSAPRVRNTRYSESKSHKGAQETNAPNEKLKGIVRQVWIDI